MFTHDEKSNINVRRFCMISECGQKMIENVMIMSWIHIILIYQLDYK